MFSLLIEFWSNSVRRGKASDLNKAFSFDDMAFFVIDLTRRIFSNKRDHFLWVINSVDILFIINRLDAISIRDRLDDVGARISKLIKKELFPFKKQ